MENVKTHMPIEDEIALHKTGWIVQRIVWGVLFCLLLAASLGAFGSGWLSTRHLSAQSYRVTYEKFARYESVTTVKIYGQSENGTIRVSIPQEYFQDVEIEKIMPAPQKQEVRQGFTMFTFAVTEAALIKFYIIPQTTGRIQSQMIVNGLPFEISHFIYP